MLWFFSTPFRTHHTHFLFLDCAYHLRASEPYHHFVFMTILVIIICITMFQPDYVLFRTIYLLNFFIHCSDWRSYPNQTLPESFNWPLMTCESQRTKSRLILSVKFSRSSRLWHVFLIERFFCETKKWCAPVDLIFIRACFYTYYVHSDSDLVFTFFTASRWLGLACLCVQTRLCKHISSRPLASFLPSISTSLIPFVLAVNTKLNDLVSFSLHVTDTNPNDQLKSWCQRVWTVFLIDCTVEQQTHRSL